MVTGCFTYVTGATHHETEWLLCLVTTVPVLTVSHTLLYYVSSVTFAQICTVINRRNRVTFTIIYCS